MWSTKRNKSQRKKSKFVKQRQVKKSNGFQSIQLYRLEFAELLVYGYIHRSSETFSMTIPSSIQQLCVSYYYEKMNIRITDQCCNSYTLQYPDKPHFAYKGASRKRSSTGRYNGGPSVKYNVKSEKEVLEWRNLVIDVLNDTENHYERRKMGTWIIRMEGKSGCYISGGECLSKLHTALVDVKLGNK